MCVPKDMRGNVFVWDADFSQIFINVLHVVGIAL